MAKAGIRGAEKNPALEHLVFSKLEENFKTRL